MGEGRGGSQGEHHDVTQCKLDVNKEAIDVSQFQERKKPSKGQFLLHNSSISVSLNMCCILYTSTGCFSASVAKHLIHHQLPRSCGQASHPPPASQKLKPSISSTATVVCMQASLPSAGSFEFPAAGMHWQPWVQPITSAANVKFISIVCVHQYGGTVCVCSLVWGHRMCVHQYVGTVCVFISMGAYVCVHQYEDIIGVSISMGASYVCVHQTKYGGICDCPLVWGHCMCVFISTGVSYVCPLVGGGIVCILCTTR